MKVGMKTRSEHLPLSSLPLQCRACGKTSAQTRIIPSVGLCKECLSPLAPAGPPYLKQWYGKIVLIQPVVQASRTGRPRNGRWIACPRCGRVKYRRRSHLNVHYCTLSCWARHRMEKARREHGSAQRTAQAPR